MVSDKVVQGGFWTMIATEGLVVAPDLPTAIALRQNGKGCPPRHIAPADHPSFSLRMRRIASGRDGGDSCRAIQVSSASS